MILDPEYGIGAYKISGGESGGFLNTLLMRLQFYAGFWKSFATSYPALARAIGGQITALASTIYTIIAFAQKCPLGVAAIGAVITLGLSLTLLTMQVALIAATGGAGVALTYGFAAIQAYVTIQFKRIFIQEAC